MVEVSNNGSTWTTVWDNGNNWFCDGMWVQCTYDISAVADNQPTVYIRWTMGPIDSGDYTCSGWNIDDIRLSGTYDDLRVTPSGLNSRGYEGGPFVPSRKNYTLRNTGAAAVNWTAADVNAVPWLDVAPNSGTLEPSQSTVVSVSINANANGLAIGNYGTAVKFRNLTSGIDRVRPVTLTVREIPPDGWASMNGGTTGGADGNVVTVTTAAQLTYYANTVGITPYIIRVSGTIDLGGEVKIQSNKTIRGIGTNPTIIGNLRFVNSSSNIIIERLNITNPSGYGQKDGITVKEDIKNVFITKCTFYDCFDGCIDITRRSDWVTVSWCKFYYTTDAENWNINKISGDDENTDDLGKLHVTFHHNWWSTMRNKGGMPRVYFGRVHLYNNYYNCPDSTSLHIGAGRESQVLIENNYFEDVNYPYYTWYYDNDPNTIGKIGASGNIFYNCIWWDDGDDDVFTPSYSYTLDNGNDVKAIVMAGAGAPACYGDFDRSELVGFNDLAQFVEYWLKTNNIADADYYDDGIVDFRDFALLAQNWKTDFTAPLAPKGLAATAGDAKVLLDWYDNTEIDLAGYNIYRSTTSGSGYTKVNTSLQTSSDYNDTGVTNNTTYYYVVKAVDTSSNESGYSSQVSATPHSTTPPAVPTGLSATSGDAKVLLDWNDNNEPDLAGYNIYRSTTSGSGYTKVNTSLQTSSDYNDTGVTNGTTYYYVVTAVDTSSDESGHSIQASATPSATPTAPQNLMVPPMAYDDTQIILIWSKPVDYSQVTDYRVYQDGNALGLSGTFDTNRPKLYYIVTGLTANTTYDFTVKSVLSGGGESEASNTCSKTTANTPTVFLPENYGAEANGVTKDTAAIQAAINDCTAGGKVLLQAGKTFLSGAIFLKSNMTLQIDGTLLGSSNPADYPYTSLRFPYYASGNNYMGLINAYYDYTNPNSAGKPYGTITNVRICGSGVINGCEGYSADNPHTITGHGNTTLGYAESALHGETNRGDMITIKGVNQVYVGGWGGTLTLVYPAEHTIFISYCNDVTVSDVNCDTWDIHNGDGINLCTSNTAYIFNSAFDTGDDCINMNAGQAQPGVDENVPDQNIRVFNCTTERGHGGYVIGSFTAAWVQDSLIEDCVFSTTDGIGIRMKTGNNNGGGGRRITCRDITVTGVANQGIFLDSTYSADGYPGAGPGQFSGNIFKNINVTATGDSIYIYGLSGTPHTQNIFENITGDNRAYLRYCTDSDFINVNVPSWTIGDGCSGNTSSNCPGCPF